MSASPEYTRAPHWPLPRPVAAAAAAATVEGFERALETVAVAAAAEGCVTPSSEGCRLPVIASVCPAAPRKPARAFRCKRRLSELEFFVVRAEELESLFRRRGEEEVTSEVKRRKING